MGIRISRKITNHETANGLRELMNDFSNFDVGFVVRSKSQFYSFEQIKNEAKELIEKKSMILSQKERAKSPKCLYVAADPIMAYLRDMEGGELQRIVVDNRLIKRQISDNFSESYQDRKIPIEFVDCPVSVFESYGFEQKIIDLYLTTIELPSGGKITIEETAACDAVDIDSGSYLGGRGEESSAFAVNQEAACEVARQITLRNLSGQIIIDFLQNNIHSFSYINF